MSGGMPEPHAAGAAPLHADIALKAAIDRVCRGWSSEVHWSFFNQILGKVSTIRKICILGVYFGRDTAYMATILRHLGRDGFHITGVDKFSDAPCADWAPDQRGKSWEEAGFGPAPRIDVTRANLEALGLMDHVSLHAATAEDFLDTTGEVFDFIYVDTSHDYATTRDTILRALPRLTPQGLIAGDDFSDEGTWGVAQAVRELCPGVRVFGNWIWFGAGVEFKQEAP